jgi:cytochrome c biogenesis protein CcmG, thiol:disulfide interchange protein DsbE
MTRTRIAALILAIAILLVPGLAAAQISQTPPPAPDTKFVTLEGKTVALSSFKGKVVLLDFWATWCGPCRLEMPTLQKIQDALGPKGLVVVGISLDKNPPIQVPPFLKKLGISYRNLADNPQDPCARKWDVGRIPKMYLIDRQGRVARQWLGVTPEGMLVPAIEEVLAAK